MRIDPGNGQDIPVECASATIQIGEQRFLVTDLGSCLSIQTVYGAGKAECIVAQHPSGDTALISAGVKW